MRWRAENDRRTFEGNPSEFIHPCAVEPQVSLLLNLSALQGERYVATGVPWSAGITHV